jgi:brefeldin A-resistance guanine nucleotide exchange factor 1
MTVEEFIRNVRGTNDGINFEKDYLHAIYDAIQENEIVMPEEHGESEVGFDYQWREVLKKSSQWSQWSTSKEADSINFALGVMNSQPISQISRFDSSVSPHAFLIHCDQNLFSHSWKAVAPAIIYGNNTDFIRRSSLAFNVSESQTMLQKSITAYYQLCSLAFYYGAYEVLDELVVAILESTKLIRPRDFPASRRHILDSWLLSRYTNEYDFRRRRGQFLLWFGKNFRCQVAALVVFRVFNEFGDGIREGWSLVQINPDEPKLIL